jgi:hypothetical protein
MLLMIAFFHPDDRLRPRHRFGDRAQPQPRVVLAATASPF